MRLDRLQFMMDEEVCPIKQLVEISDRYFATMRSRERDIRDELIEVALPVLDFYFSQVENEEQ